MFRDLNYRFWTPAIKTILTPLLTTAIKNSTTATTAASNHTTYSDTPSGTAIVLADTFVIPANSVVTVSGNHITAGTTVVSVATANGRTTLTLSAAVSGDVPVGTVLALSAATPASLKLPNGAIFEVYSVVAITNNTYQAEFKGVNGVNANTGNFAHISFDTGFAKLLIAYLNANVPAYIFSFSGADHFPTAYNLTVNVIPAAGTANVAP